MPHEWVNYRRRFMLGCKSIKILLYLNWNLARDGKPVQDIED